MHRTLALLVVLSACKTEEADPNHFGQKNDAPWGSFTSHESDDQILNGSTVRFVAQVDDDDDRAHELLVRISLGDAVLCEDLVPLDDGETVCEATVDVEALRSSTQEARLRLQVQDPGGLTGVAGIDLVVLLSDPPEVDILSPSEGSTLYGDQGISLRGTVSDDFDAATDLSVWWESDLDGAIAPDLTPEGSGDVSADVSLSAGTHVLTMYASDTGGGVGTDTVTVTVHDTNTAPTCSIEAPEADAIVALGSSVTLQGNATDGEDPYNQLSASWTSDVDGEIASGAVAADNTYTINTSELSAGDHSLGFVVTDTQGEVCSTSVAIHVGGPPEIAITDPLDGFLANEWDDISFGATVWDSTDLAEDVALSWESDLDGVLDTTPSDSTGAAGFAQDLTWGTHTITLTATDLDGLTSTDEITVVVNGRPSAPTISLSPADPSTTDDLEVRIDADGVDPEGDTVSYTYSWTVGGVGSGGGTSGTLDDSFTSAGETWEVTVIPTDGVASGTAATASLTIGNTVPSISSVSLGPTDATEGDTLGCTYSGYSDADADADQSTYAWTVDGIAVAPTTSSLDDSYWDRDDPVVCTVTPYDGYGTGTPIPSNTVTIGNSAPSISSVSIDNTSPVVGDTLTCSYSGYTDADSDVDQSTYSWTIAGTEVGTSSTLSSGFVGGDTVACTVTPSDGSDDGTALSTSVTVDNTAPSLVSVTLTPTTATEASTLTCAPGTTTDADGDTVSYSYAWSVDGSTVAGTLSTLSGSSFDKDDPVFCSVTPTDGTDAGTAVDSNTVTIDNTLPVLSTVALSDSSPQTNDVLSVSTAYTDADSDTVSLAYAWFVGGTQVSTSSQLSGISSFEKGQSVYVTVTPSDDDGAGTAVDSSTVTVANTAPTAAEISVSPEDPDGSTEDILCSVDTDATDDDSADTVSYTFTWEVDGSVYPDDFGGATGPDTTAETDDTVPAADTSLGTDWTCFVTPNDGDDDGPDAEATATVSSTPPSAALSGGGYTATGNTTLSTQSGYLLYVPITLTAGDTVTGFGVRFISIVGTAGTIEMALYDDSGPSGAPGDKLAGMSSSLSYAAADNTYSATAAYAVSSSGTYYVGYVLTNSSSYPYLDGATSGSVTWYYGSGSTMPDPASYLTSFPQSRASIWVEGY